MTDQVCPKCGEPFISSSLFDDDYTLLVFRCDTEKSVKLTTGQVAYVQEGNDCLRHQLAQADDRAEREKDIRVRYQDAMYSICRILDASAGRGVTNGQGILWQDVAKEVGLILAENRRLSNEWQQCHDRNAELCAEHTQLEAENIHLREIVDGVALVAVEQSWVNIFPDGDQFCCTWHDFDNLQVSPAAFAPSEHEAAVEFITAEALAAKEAVK